MFKSLKDSRMQKYSADNRDRAFIMLFLSSELEINLSCNILLRIMLQLVINLTNISLFLKTQLIIIAHAKISSLVNCKGIFFHMNHYSVYPSERMQ